jgi:hypothetical protein
MRRRRYSLLLALVPVALAVTTLAVLSTPGFNGDAPQLRQDVSKPSTTAPDRDVRDQSRNQHSAAPSALGISAQPSAPPLEPTEKPDLDAAPSSRPAAGPRAGEVYGRPRVAMAPTSEHTVGVEPYDSPVRMASVSSGSGPSGAAYKSTGSPASLSAGPSAGGAPAGGGRGGTLEQPDRSGGVPGDAEKDPTGRDAGNTPTIPGAGAPDREVNIAPVAPGLPELPVVRVPEPASLGLMLLALLGCAVHRGLRR